MYPILTQQLVTERVRDMRSAAERARLAREARAARRARGNRRGPRPAIVPEIPAQRPVPGGAELARRGAGGGAAPARQGEPATQGELARQGEPAGRGEPAARLAA